MSPAARASVAPLALRGPALTFSGDPFQLGLARTMLYEPDAIVAMADGHITHFGPADATMPVLPPGIVVERCGDAALILPGFIDAHVHYPQTPMIGAFGEHLIPWLDTYTYATEQQFADAKRAREVARVYLDENLRNGITTACVFCTVHPQSVDALFEEGLARGVRLIAGKVLMDRNAPEALLDTAQSGYDESKALIARWHGRERLAYAITPRFAPASSPAQLDAAGALFREHPGCYLQSHIAENRREVAWVAELFPERKDYFDVYEHHGCAGPRAIYGHGIWLSDDELARFHASGTALAHCPTSNFFLGSGCLDLGRVTRAERPVRVALATDLGAGTTFSMLGTMNEAYKAAQMNAYPLSGGHAFYMATRGGAHALYLEDRIGSLAPGMEADLCVLDLRPTPLIEFRMHNARDIHEALFVLATLGDDRAVAATYVGGRLAYRRT